MPKYHIVVLTTLLAITLLPGASRAVGLADLPRDENFTLYRVPSPANEMRLETLRGRPVSLSQLKGKVVLLNFWKIDCPPCAMEKPILERVHRRFGPQGLEIVAVNLFDDFARMISYVRQGGYTFTFAYDRNNSFSVKQQPMNSGVPTSFVVNSNAEAIYEVKGVPTTYVINRDGKVVGHAVGMVNWEQGPMLGFLQSLLGPPSPTVAAVKRHPANLPAGESPARAAVVAHHPDRSASGQDDLFVQQSPREMVKPGPSVRKPPQRKEVRSRRANSRSVRTRAETTVGAQRAVPQRRSSRLVSPPARSRSSVSPSRVSGPALSRHVTDQSTSMHTARRGTAGLDRSRNQRTGAPSPSATPIAKREMHTRMNPLPPAAPYYRPGTPQSQRSQTRAGRLKAPVIYDENGYVMARIPGSEAASEVNRGHVQQFQQSGAPVDQQAGSNPINGFILESFETGPSVSARRPAARRVRPNAQEDSSFFGRITSGITSTLSSINPLSR